MQLNEPLLQQYLADPLGQDAAVRRELKIPDDRYYAVSVWPKPGRVSLHGSRTVRAVKISKSPSPQ